MRDRLAVDRGDANRERLGRERRAPAPHAGAFACKTVEGSSYPTGAQEYYFVRRIAFEGDEVEAGALDERDVGEPFLAACLGSEGPPEGTRVIVRRCGNRWAFQYYGEA